MKGEHVVVDSAAVLDLMIATDVGLILESRLEGCVLHAPSHMDAEVADGIGRLERARVLSPSRALDHLDTLAAAPIERHPLPALLDAAWKRRDNMALSEALYVVLARSLGLSLITTDPSIANTAVSVAELIGRDRAS